MEWAVPAVVLFCVFAVAVACFAFKYATDALIEVKAMQRSTHNIQFVPAEPPRSGDDDLDEAMASAERRDYARAGDIHDASEPLM